MLLVMLLLFYQPSSFVVEMPSARPDVVAVPGNTITHTVYTNNEDKLPLNVEIFIKKLVEQQLVKKQDNILAHIMQSSPPNTFPLLYVRASCSQICGLFLSILVIFV